MNNISRGRLYILPLVIMLGVILPACKKDSGGAPSITGVRNYVASPNDTIYTSLVANGQWVVITGQNLQNPVQIEFDGVPASFNSALLAPNSAVVQIPTIVFSTIDTSQLYTIRYMTRAGSTTFAFKLGPAAPTVTAISNVFANPGDSVFIYGANLVLVQQFSYGGTPITSFHSSADGTSLGFLMPAQTPTDQVLITTKSGSVNFKIVATPIITGISNENATGGDSVYIYGNYLKNIQSLTFAGADINSFATANDGSWVGFILPAPTQSGPVSVTTSFGTTTTTYVVNTNAGGYTTGMLANMEWGNYFGWQWWGDASLTVDNVNNNGGWITTIPDFDGILGINTTMFMSFNTGTLSAGGSKFLPIGSNSWVPTANLTDPVDSWALKFEISVAHPWNGSTLCFVSGFAGAYTARYEPWQVTASGTANFSTRGWQTVTIPLSSFRANDASLGDGKGAPVTSLANLLGSSGSTNLNVTIKNYGKSASVTDFYAGIDNIRVMKIK